MRVLITGVNGFVGLALATRLHQDGHEVTGIGRQTKAELDCLSQYIQGDVTDISVFDQCGEQDAIVHLAALTAHSDIVDDKYRALSINLEGTQNSLRAMDMLSAKRLLYASTGKVYGDIQYLPITEDHPANPLNVLGKSKLIAERLIDFYAQAGQKHVIFRIFNVFGPGQKANFLLPTIFGQIRACTPGQLALKLGDMTAQRDYVHINDVVAAIVKGLTVPEEGIADCEIFNIGSGRPHSAQDIVDTLAKGLGETIQVESNKSLIRNDEQSIEYADLQKAKRLLDWQPSISIEEWLLKTAGDLK